MTNSYKSHYFHLIWSTKGRRNYIFKSLRDRLYSYMGAIIHRSGGRLVEIGGVENHVHLLIELNNLDNFTKLVQNTKANSTNWLKKEFLECKSFGWQDGFGSYTVSYSQLESVRNYIGSQEEHHKNTSFETEYKKILDFCNLKYEEKYLFDEQLEK